MARRTRHDPRDERPDDHFPLRRRGVKRSIGTGIQSIGS